MKAKSFLKSEFPLLNECYQYVRWELKRPQQKRNQKEFFELTDAQRIELCEQQYFQKLGRKLDWNHLETFNEKIQWEKMFDHDPQRTRLADKYAVRRWVAETIGEEYLVPIYGMWERYQDIEWEKLPNQFVLKTNHGCGDTVIVKDKNKMNLQERLECRRKLIGSMETDFSAKNCEMHYRNIPRKIIAEKLLGNGAEEASDYKFFCFDGKPVVCWIDRNRHSNHCRDFYDMQWNHLPWRRELPNYPGENPPPCNFDKMIELAKKLSEGFAQVRVDLYNLNGIIYFGEMTFTSGAGYGKFQPAEVDKIMGEWWQFDTHQGR